MSNKNYLFGPDLTKEELSEQGHTKQWIVDLLVREKHKTN